MMSNKNILLEIENINKSFGKIKVLKNLELKMKKGTILGLLGENGAGKSTTIGILTGSIKADSGTIKYKGKEKSLKDKDYRQNIAYCPQDIALFFELNCYQNLKFWANAYNISKNEIENRIQEVSKDFKLESVLNRKPDTLSGGYQRRLNIACSVLHKPEILFLDEPTVGIDVSVRRDILAIVRKLSNEGMSILYTSHYIDELEQISDEVLIIKEGEKITLLDKSDYMNKSLEDIYLSLV